MQQGESERGTGPGLDRGLSRGQEKHDGEEARGWDLCFLSPACSQSAWAHVRDGLNATWRQGCNSEHLLFQGAFTEHRLYARHAAAGPGCWRCWRT